jgi:tetratricopeptide (TPR) repeat protein
MFRRRTSARLAAFLLLVSIATVAQKSSGPSAVNQAKSQIARNDLDTAEKTLWTIISSEPNNVQALTLLATIRMKQHRGAEAEALLRRVLQLDPHAPEARKTLALALLAQNNLEGAISNLRDAIASAPQDNSLKVQLAQLYTTQGKFAEAFSTIQSVPDRALPVSAVPVKAAALLGTGRTAAAAALIPRVSSSMASTLDLAEVFVNAKQPDLALRTISQARKPAKTPARLYYLQGAAQRLKGELSAAKRSFSSALAADPTSTPTLIALAEIAAAEKRTSESVALLQRANKADPNSVAVLRYLVPQAMNAGLHGLVEQAALDLEKKSPDPDDQYLAGAALLQEREYEIAARIFDRYVAEWPQESKAFLALGLAYLNLQRFPEAQQALERALQLDPNLVEAEYSLGVLFSKEGNNEKALLHFERVLKVQPEHSKALLDAGTIYLQEGELEKASSALQASEKADASDPNLQYQLSLLYNRQGNTEQARKHMELFRSLKQNKGGSTQAAQ